MSGNEAIWRSRFLVTTILGRMKRKTHAVSIRGEGTGRAERSDQAKHPQADAATECQYQDADSGDGGENDDDGFAVRRLFVISAAIGLIFGSPDDEPHDKCGQSAEK